MMTTQSIPLLIILRMFPPYNNSSVKYDFALSPSSGNPLAIMVVTEFGKKANKLTRLRTNNILHNLTSAFLITCPLIES